MSPTSRGQPAASSGRPTRALEQLFLTMHARKLDRDLNGPQKKKTRFHFVALACLLVLSEYWHRVHHVVSKIRSWG